MCVHVQAGCVPAAPLIPYFDQNKMRSTGKQAFERDANS